MLNDASFTCFEEDSNSHLYKVMKIVLLAYVLLVDFLGDIAVGSALDGSNLEFIVFMTVSKSFMSDVVSACRVIMLFLLERLQHQRETCTISKVFNLSCCFICI